MGAVMQANASEAQGKLLPRQLQRRAYNAALVKRFRHLPDVRRIERHRHLPAALYKVPAHSHLLANMPAYCHSSLPGHNHARPQYMSCPCLVQHIPSCAGAELLFSYARPTCICRDAALHVLGVGLAVQKTGLEPEQILSCAPLLCMEWLCCFDANI